MSTPDYFFRARPGGAAVFKVDKENRQKRLDMTRIAQVFTKARRIKPTGQRELSEQDLAAIETWLDERASIDAFRRFDDIHRAIDTINEVAYWATQEASDDQLEDVTEPLLMAMHDLRSVLIRQKANRITARLADENG